MLLSGNPQNNEQAIISGSPAQKAGLKEGDIISLDMAATYNGFVGDTATTIPVGEVSDELKQLIRVTEESLNRAIAQCRVNNRLGDVGWAIQEIAEEHGYGIVRDYTGHGIGRSMHEAPQIPNFGKKGLGIELTEGMVLAIEPMVNSGRPEAKVLGDKWTAVTLDGSYSAHFEHCVAVTKQGPMILTQ